MFHQITGLTDVFSTHTGQKMALKSARTAQPMAELEPDHVTRELATQPIPAQTPDPDQKHVEDSHLGRLPDGASKLVCQGKYM